ncbi:MAG: SBBP repeat-containing protein [Caldilineaceae bacterium]|nr:SBBP repeat-containing protein [Caldilineaceae bacterium]
MTNQTTTQRTRRSTSIVLAVVVSMLISLFPQALPGVDTPTASAHNLDQRMNWIQFDTATSATLDARITANDLPLMRVGDELGMIVKVTPTDGTTTGVGGYVTVYLPTGVQVVDVGYLSPDGLGGYNEVPMKGQAIEPLGYGPIGPATTSQLVGLTLGPNIMGQTSPAVSPTGVHLGTMAGVYGDTGIFYSTDPDTAWNSWVNSSPALGTSITSNSGDDFVPFNKWDAEQMYAWGIKSPVSPIIDSNGRGNAPWGVASGVAGPQSGYQWAFDKAIWDASAKDAAAMRASIVDGPWNRIQYPGSQIAFDEPGRTDNTLGFAGVDGSQIGWNPNAAPLPATVSQTDGTSPKAIRWSVGALIENRPEYVWFKVKLLDVSLYQSNCVAIYHADVFGGDAGGEDGGKDHLWRYYDPTTANLSSCVALSKSASRPVVALNDVFTYDVRAVNTSTNITLTSVQVKDLLPSGVTFLSASPSANSGPNPLIWNIPSLGPGESFQATVTVRAKSKGLAINQLCLTAANLGEQCVDEGTYLGATPLLQQSKSVNTASVAPGGNVQYTLLVDNIGTGASGSPIPITENLPSGFTFVSLDSVTVNGANAMLATTVNSANLNRPIFTVNRAIDASKALVLKFTAKVPSTVVPGLTYCNSYSTAADAVISTGTQACVTVGGAKIGDTIFRDWNGNGVQDTGEEGIAGVTVDLKNGGGTVIATKVTDASGGYLFTGLTAGTYTVDVTPPANHTLTTPPEPRSVTVITNQNKLDVDFGYRPTGTASIGDLVFEDKGNDGTYNSGLGDVGIVGVTVRLYEDQNGNGLIDPATDTLITSMATGAGGAYLFSNLATGYNYIVDAVDADVTTQLGTAAWLAVTADPHKVTNLSGPYLTADFGYFKVVPGSIGDQVFIDTNSNNTYESGVDTPLANVTLVLYQDAGTVGSLGAGDTAIMTTTSSITGTYKFANLPAGNYIVDVIQNGPNVPANYAPSGTDPFPVALGLSQVYTDADFPFRYVAPPPSPLAKSVNKTNANPGDTLYYTLTTNYTGSSLLTSVTVTDAVPAGTTYAPASANAGGSESGGVLTWNLGSNVAGVPGLAGSGGTGSSLLYNTFAGGSGSDDVQGVAVDSSGNFYVVGNSDATWGSPVRAFSTAPDTFVAKFDNTGNLIWNTFLGGSGAETGRGIAVGPNGNIYVVGDGNATWGSPIRNFTAGGGTIDGFAAKLDSSGGLTWNTFLGSSANDYGNGIAVDGSSNVYVTGGSAATWGSPVRSFTAGFNDAYAVKLTTAGALTWSTFLGGAGAEEGKGIAVDGSGNVYVAGDSSATWASPVRAFTGTSNDAFAAKLTSGGALTWNTFLGGSGSELGFAIAVDSGGNAYVSGYGSATWGAPLRSFGGTTDGFAAKLSSTGGLTWNTFLGGSATDRATAIALDGIGNVYVAGDSLASWGTPDRPYTSLRDAFAVKLTNGGTLTSLSFYGSAQDDFAQGVAVDGSGNVFVAGYGAATWGSPVRSYTAGSDGFVAKVSAGFSSPTMAWNSFQGGSGSDYANGVAVDSNGYVYVAGWSSATWGSPLRAFAGGSEAFVAKLTGSGNLIWNTFLGSSGSDYAYGLAVDGSGNVYVVGQSDANWGSPVRAKSTGSDGFVAKLNSSGSLTWNTFLGGAGTDYGYGVAVDDSGNVYLAGHSDATWGSPVRAYTSGVDAFAAKLTSSGGLTWNTFLGGAGTDDRGQGIAVDNAGSNVYVAGYSNATWGSPVRSYTSGTSLYDGFAAKLSASGGSLTWNTFLGGGGYDAAKSVAVDGSGNVYAAGSSNATWGSPAQSYSGSGYDVLAAKLDASGTLIWNTFLGGSGLYDSASSISAHSSGKVYVTGTSDATWGSPLNGFGGAYDAFAAALNGSNGSRLWHTFLGGSDYDNGNAGAIDSYGNVYVAGDSAATWGFPARAYSSGNDSFVAKIGDGGVSTMLASTISASSDDAEEAGPDATGTYSPGYMDLTSSDLELTQDFDTSAGYSGGTQKIGLRFNALTVPKGATILNAYITFRAISADSPNTNSGATSLTLRGQAADNPTTFTSTAWDITNRITTTASVAWSPSAWTTGTDYNTPSLSAIAQEIVNRSGWASGNSMVFIVTGTGSRSAEDWNSGGANKPRLVLEYTLPSATGPTLGNVMAATPTLVTSGGKITVTMILTATQSIASVGPNTLTITGTNGVTATLVSGPTPASGTVGTGGTTFTWVYNTSGTGNLGQLTFGGKAGDGGSNSWPWAVSNSVIVAPPLTFRATVNTISPPALVDNTGYIKSASVIPVTPSNTVQTHIGASIGDFVWADLDGNGIQNVGEPGLNGVQVCATPTAGGATTCATTDALGAYRIYGLTNGVSYNVALNTATAPSGYLPTTATSLTRTATTAGVTDADFGLRPPGAASIGDTVWIDANENGVVDNGEGGLPGITVRLLNSAGTTLLTTATTNASGLYTFTGLYAGNYQVQVETSSVVTTSHGITSTILAALDLVSVAGSTVSLTTPLTVNVPTNNSVVTTADFGFNWGGSIGDYVWWDDNVNQVQDEAAGRGIPDVAVLLYYDANGNGKYDGSFVDTQVGYAQTNASGYYLLDNLPPGVYLVDVYEDSITTDGNRDVVPSTPNIVNVNPTPNQDVTTADFGYFEGALIGDTVWRDDDSNGIENGSEPGVSGVRVYLYDSTGTTLLNTKTTDGNGNYLFSVWPGDYVVRVEMADLPAGLTLATTPTSFIMTVAAGKLELDVDFGFAYNGEIGDFVFRDSNNNGVYDPATGESGLGGVTVYLYRGGTMVDAQATGGNGAYLFQGLPAGTYTVTADAASLPTGYVKSALGAANTNNNNQAEPYTLVLPSGGSIRHADFGYLNDGIATGQSVRSVGGFIWNDLNGDGIYNSGTEPVIPGVDVVVNCGANGTYTTISTSATFGANWLTSVTVTEPASCTITVDTTDLPSTAYLATGDPDVAPPNAVPGVCVGCDNKTTITVNGGDVLGKNFGYQQQFSTISGTVCVDGGGISGQCDLPGETPIQGITITLVSAGPDGFFATGDEITQTLLTDASGNYTFTNLLAGNYQVRETDGVGYISVADADGFNPNLIDVALAPGQTAADRDFVDAIVPGTIGDLVWYDTDGNGVKGGSEVGIPGVVISLTNSVGSVITTTTNAAGIYTFTNLLTGAYTVTVMSGTPVSATAINLGDSKISPYTVNLGIGQVITNADFGYDLIPAYALSKVLITGQPARTREVVSFRIAITNTGAGVIDFLPLADTYNEVLLRFVSASTAPDNSANDGTLNWTDLTATLGDIAPGGVISVTVNFEALRDTTGLPSGNAQNVATASGVTVDPDGAGPLGSLESLPPTADSATVIILGPTGVTLINTSVRPLTQGDPAQVQVAWETVSELNVAGFYVYRLGPGDAVVKLSDLPMLARKSGQAEGTPYTFLDATAVQGVGYSYVLQILLTSGQTEEHTLGTVQWMRQIFLPLVVR